MSEEKKPAPEEKPLEDDVPAHATEQEKERLKDFNKGGIPPGAC
ncbi:hypothetical protein [Pseudomonas syringae]|nr:hypothetical protein [Pseudomonas syringae]